MKKLPTILLISLMSIAPLFSTIEKQDTQEHVVVPQKTNMQKKQHCAQMKEGKRKQKSVSLIAKGPYYEPLHIGRQRIKQFPPNGAFIELIDGSGWTVHENDRKILKGGDWTPNALVQIQPNDTHFFWRGNCTYKLYNLHSRESVQVELSQGPYTTPPAGMPSAKRISFFDHARQQVVLTDNTAWQIVATPANRAIFQNWQVNDFIIIGANNWYWYNWIGFWPPYILINVSDNSYVVATTPY